MHFSALSAQQVAHTPEAVTIVIRIVKLKAGANCGSRNEESINAARQGELGLAAFKRSKLGDPDDANMAASKFEPLNRFIPEAYHDIFKDY